MSSNINSNLEKKTKKCFIPQRYVLAVMGSMALMNAYTMRVCLSLAITEMVVSDTQNNSLVNSVDETCPMQESDLEFLSKNPHSIDNSKKYDWTEEQQGIILSSFYWGYIFTHLPGGILSEIFGGKHLLGVGILITGILTLLTPIVVDYGGWRWLVALRVIQGFGEGITFPALNVLLANWAPMYERAKLGTLVYSGAQVGTIMANMLGGFLIHYTNQWSSVFYFFGTVTVIWYIFWNIMCYSRPESHPFISEYERDYLKKSIIIEKIDKNHRIPWSHILTSTAVFALIIAQIGHDWVFFTMITDLPKYLKDVLKYSVAQNGLFSSIPYIVMLICSILSACLCDWLIVKNYLKITVARKLFTTIASLGPSIGILLASYSGCNKEIAVTFFIISMGLMGAFFPGMKVNALDLTTNYSGTLMALVNGIGSITGIITPYIAGVLTPNHLLTEWRVVFWISFLVNIITSSIFLTFASGKEQYWNKFTNGDSTA